MRIFYSKKLIAFITITFAVFCCASCSSVSSSNGSGDQGLLISQATEKKTIGNDLVTIDISNEDQGYICVKYNGTNKKVKLQLTKEDTTYTYNLSKQNQYAIFPLSGGSGTYTVSIFENISDNQYSQACSELLDVKMKDENLPFLYPNEYVNYKADDPIVSLSSQLTAQSTDNLQKVQSVFDYVVGTIQYDNDLAANITTGYVPNISQVLEKKKGICFDYASVMSAMLRIQGIPTKLVVGYAGDTYHAWISVFTEDKGWVEGIIQFDGKDWTMMDPTTAASSGQIDDITNDSRYNALYFY